MVVMQWANTHVASKQLRLQDQLSIPWQRLMRYRLLLKGILRHNERASNVEIERRTAIVNQKSCMKQMVVAGEWRGIICADIFAGCTLLWGCG